MSTMIRCVLVSRATTLHFFSSTDTTLGVFGMHSMANDGRRKQVDSMPLFVQKSTIGRACRMVTSGLGVNHSSNSSWGASYLVGKVSPRYSTRTLCNNGIPAGFWRRGRLSDAETSEHPVGDPEWRWRLRFRLGATPLFSSPGRHRSVTSLTLAENAGTPPPARGRGGVWTTSCLKLFAALVRPFTRCVLGGVDLLSFRFCCRGWSAGAKFA